MRRRELIRPGMPMPVREGTLIFEENGDFVWTFDEAVAPRPKNLDVFLNQNPVFGAEAYVDVLVRNKQVPNALSPPSS